MDQPLGTHVGNALEVKEAIDILAGRAEGDLMEVSLKLGGYMMLLAGKAVSPEEGEAALRRAISSGAGLQKLKEMIEAQGGDSRVCDNPSLLPQSPVIRAALCERKGYVRSMDTAALGLAAQAMGAGRLQLTDQLDYSVGFVINVRVGDRVTPDTPLCQLHARSEADAAKAEAAVRAAIRWSDEPCPRARNFYAVVTAEGVRRFGEES